MLRLLRIRNFALIDTLAVKFEPGLCVITGETGAGKSILVQALGLILGGRANSMQIRDGAENASVEASFGVPNGHAVRSTLDALGLEIDAGDDLVIRRRLSRSGKNQAFVNDQQVTLAGLTQIAQSLVDISSQHEHLSLRDPAAHITLLDRVAALGAPLAHYRGHYVRWASVKSALAELTEKNRQRLERQDFLRFQLQQFDDARVTDPDEDHELEQKRTRMRNAETLRSASVTVVDELYGSQDAAIERIDQALDALETLTRFDVKMAPLRDALATARYAVEDVAFTIRDYGGRLEELDEPLDQIEARISELSGLKRRFGPSLADVLQKQAAFSVELDALDQLDSKLDELQRSETSLRQSALGAADALSRARRQAANPFEQALNAHLQGLAMTGARFETHFERGELGEDGIDRVWFMLATNVGEKALPLSKVASGGELSRFMLALKQVSADTDPVLVTVFDEVDTGIGGTVAEVVGQMIHAAAAKRQVLCITHLPQIARRADTHYRVTKIEKDGRTISGIAPLSPSDRREELARMLGADLQAEHTLHYVEGLLSGES